jgi:hypothetical protein
VNAQEGSMNPVQPVPRMSGKTEENKSTGQQKDLFQQQINTLYDPDQIAKTLDAWSQMPQFAAQQQAVDNQKKIFGLMASQPQQVDLSPLSRLVDSWYGTKLSDGYTKPQTPQEKLAALAGYGNKLATDQKGITDSIIKAFGDSRSGQTNQLSQLLLNDEMLRRYSDPALHLRPNNFGPTNFNSYQNAVEKAMGGAKTTDEASELKSLNDLVSQNNNPTALKELPIRLDKFLTGSARVSDSQIKMLGGDPSVINQLEQSIRAKVPELTDGGYLTQKNQQEYQNLFAEYANERNKMRQLQAQWLRSPEQTSRRGLDKGAGNAALPDSMVNIFSLPSGQTPPPGAGAPAGGGGSLQDAAKAELLKRRAAKGQ